ncbi:MAG: hypothetical protein BWX84_00272 [Verrucomicrobia bacterium ADurb.Bin118]|nr:MAG: hypothetical protein BWX84_00272 [Verrucomicrobia bacterium ADurb.Bin118]
MGHAEVFANRQQIFHPLRQQRPQRDLVGQGTDINRVVASGTGMQINPVTPDPDRVWKRRRLDFVAGGAGFLHPVLGGHMLLHHGELGANPPALANVRILRQTILRAEEIRAQPQPLPAGAAIRSRRLGLQPVEQRETQLFGAREMSGRLRLRHLAKIAEPIIILWPVYQRDVARIRAGNKQRLVRQAPIRPQSRARLRIGVQLARLVGGRVRIFPGEQFARPRGVKIRDVITPEIVFARFLDHVVLARHIIHRETAGETLHVERLRLGFGVRFAGVFPGLRAGDVFRPGQRE